VSDPTGSGGLEPTVAGPDSSAVRVALWRALHGELDPPPHVLDDSIGLQLVAPADGWRQRPDMDPDATRTFRASIVARARFVEDLVMERAHRGLTQYVILGAGLDTFAQRHADLLSRLEVFEVERPATQAWKRQRLIELGFGIPPSLRFVPVDFEAGESWWKRLQAAGFSADEPAVVAATGVSMYLTREAITSTLHDAAALATGSTLVMTFLLPLELTAPGERAGREAAERGARSSGTPFVSAFTPDEMMSLARDAGFREVRHISGASLTQRYFTDAADRIRPGNAEEVLVAIT